MSTWAKPGVKCVCVDDRMGFVTGVPVPFVKGQVLIIREVIRDGLRFVGIPDIDPHDMMMKTYAISRFRPLVTRTQEQDLEQFISLLSTKPHEVDA